MTISKKRLTICVAAGLIAACTLAAPPSAGAAFTETKLSADFDWKYEMTTLMPSEENLDGNFVDPPDPPDPIYDFRYKVHGGSSASIIEGGLLSILSTGSSAYMYFGADDQTDRIWGADAENFTFADGYTIEFRIKVISSGTSGGFSMCANPVDAGDQPESQLNISDTGQSWGETPLGGTVDNTDGFHVFRVAQEEGQDNFRVWRDGVLVGADIAAPYSADYKRLVFGDRSSSSDWTGEFEVDYFRFTKGAYSPGDTLPPIPGDANNDRVVNDEDASILAAHWQQEGMNWGQGDFNGDNIVNDQDASILAAHWGQTGEGTSAPVPEPSVVVLLLGVGLIGLLARARRGR
jgi:hypothetical protein